MTVEIDSKPRIRMICENCGGSDVCRDAWAEWDEDSQKWVLGYVCDDGYCLDCQREVSIEEETIADDPDESDGDEALNLLGID